MQKGMLLLFVAGLWLGSSSAFAAEWLTVSSPNFRVHFQSQHQTWATKTATELERVRAQVFEQQGRALDVVIDAVILDPFNLPNGYALPSSDNPLMALYVTPPQSDMEIAHHQSWLQLLVLHEYIHLVHLSQPSRHGKKQWLRGLSDSYDLAVAALPRWVAEGYATLQESKLTGKGRLFDNYSEALLRAYARQGALLPYAALNFGDGSYRANAMAYLLGARFMAWLEKEFGEHTLDAVWTRIMAVESRDFELAFSGIFGQNARQLYRRFIAQYTYHAMQQALTYKPSNSREFMRFHFAARDIEFSPSLRQFAAVETNQQRETVLNIYSSAENSAALSKFKARQKALLERDPKDIADRQPDSFIREVIATFIPTNFSGIYYPQWADEETLYFVARNKGQLGNHVTDLYRWHIPSDRLTRISKGLGIRRFTLLNQNEIIAERVHNGFSQMIRFDMQRHALTSVFDDDLNTVFDYPTVDSSKRFFAYLKQTPALGWQLYINDLTAGFGTGSVIVPLPEQAQYVTAPRWQAGEQKLYFVAGTQGELGLYQYDLSDQTTRQLSLGQHVFEEVAGNLDGQLLFLESTPYGAKLSSFALPIEMHSAVLATDTGFPSLDDYVEQPTDEQWQIAPYQARKQNWAFTVATHLATASEHSVGVGIAGSDILKSFSWQVGANISPDNDFFRGGYADIQYMGSTFEVRNALRIFDINMARQSSGRIANLASFKGWSNTLEVATTHESDRWTLRPYAGWFVEELQAHSGNQSYWLGNKLAFHHDQQAFAFGFSVDAARIWGDNHGHDFNIGGYTKLWHWPIFLQSSNRYRNTTKMQLGGYHVNSLYGETGASTLQSAELPFAYATGRHYLSFEFATSWKLGMPRFYIKNHQLDGDNIAQSWGAKWQLDLTRKVLGSAAQFAPAGVSNLRLDVGLSKVLNDDFEDEWRAWLGLWHAL
ncbi:hypothetical protein N474_15990 [Pseudoalteromonas luteoviolacea CPMOR-2]|uniref:hypothetical protein n=1 Tax=Pseudoalteromonas luteoviolacea TaxID=43657 RepID=UPI0007B07477|nr:hypothetical protein [Pseudoalteromonas luteoviolacea]KZN55205.1 hypothetical protein N474_15990 [Pseudoalteromonas luteoviolacea CPMOR-2]